MGILLYVHLFRWLKTRYFFHLDLEIFYLLVHIYYIYTIYVVYYTLSGGH